MKISILISILFSFSLWAAPLPPQERFIGRITKKDASTYIIRSASGVKTMAHLSRPELQRVFEELLPGDEVLADGHVEYVSSFQDSRISYTPVLIIDNLSPVSLKRLGVTDSKNQPRSFPSLSLATPYSPGGFTTTANVTSGLILTASVLLFQTLMAPSTGGDPRQDINNGLTLFAGTLATGIFLFDDLK